MSVEELHKALQDYNDQKKIIEDALNASNDGEDHESLLSLKNDLNQLIQLTQESLDTIESKAAQSTLPESNAPVIDDEYALFMAEMEQSGAYDDVKPSTSKPTDKIENNEDSDIVDELSSLLGMKCAVYHTHKWGGQPTLHNAMVMSIVPHEEEVQFKDIEVRVLFTHPTHAEMLPCPFFLSGECKFDDEKCRYSHGTVVLLSEIKDAMEPNFDSIKIGSRVLLKLKPPDDLDMSTTKKSTEKYHLWHQAVVKYVDQEKRSCSVRYEHGVQAGEKRKSASDEVHVAFENILPLDNAESYEPDSEGSLSDTEYPECKSSRPTPHDESQLIATTAKTTGHSMGEWERHTRGIGSKLMLAMGYVPGSGLGAAAEGRVAPVEAALLPRGRGLDAVMELNAVAGDNMKVEQRLKRLQKKEEERNKRALEREQESERRNVFNIINRVLGDKAEVPNASTARPDLKQTTSKDLNIEKFKIEEETKRLEKEIVKLNGSLQRYTAGTPGHASIAAQLHERNTELTALKNKEQKITKEQNQRNDKKKMTVF